MRVLTKEQQALITNTDLWAGNPVVFEICRDKSGIAESKLKDLIVHLKMNGYRNITKIAPNMMLIDDDEASYIGTCAEDFGIDHWLTWDAFRLIPAN